MIEPVHPFEGRVLHGVQGAPGTASVDDFGLEQANHRLGKSVVVGVTNAADRGFYAGFCQTLSVSNAEILRPVITVVG